MALALLSLLVVAGWAWGAEFFAGEFAVAVFVFGFEAFYGVFDFFGGEFAVMVDVQDDHDRARGGTVAAAGLLTLLALTALLVLLALAVLGIVAAVAGILLAGTGQYLGETGEYQDD